MQHAVKVRRMQSDASWSHVRVVLTTLGNISIAWAGVELMLSHLVIWHHVQNQLKPEKGLPRMLAYQLEYVKKSIETDWKIDVGDRARIQALRLRIAELNEFRVNITHGVVHQRNRRTTDWHTHSIKIDGLQWRVIQQSYSNEEIQNKAREIQELGSELSPFIARVIGMPHPANSSNILRASSGTVTWRP